MYVHWHRHTLPHMTVITTSKQSNIFSQFFPVCINQSNILLQFSLYRGDTVKRDFKNVSIFRHGKSSEEWEIIPFPCFKLYCGVSLCSIHVYNSTYSRWNQRSIFQARNRWISNRTTVTLLGMIVTFFIWISLKRNTKKKVIKNNELTSLRISNWLFYGFLGLRVSLTLLWIWECQLTLYFLTLDVSYFAPSYTK